VDIYYKGVQVRAVTLTISATGLASASQTHNITAGITE
jgi:hypothetical protein